MDSLKIALKLTESKIEQKDLDRIKQLDFAIQLYPQAVTLITNAFSIKSDGSIKDLTHEEKQLPEGSIIICLPSEQSNSNYYFNITSILDNPQEIDKFKNNYIKAFESMTKNSAFFKSIDHANVMYNNPDEIEQYIFTGFYKSGFYKNIALNESYYTNTFKKVAVNYYNNFFVKTPVTDTNKIFTKIANKYCASDWRPATISNDIAICCDVEKGDNNLRVAVFSMERGNYASSRFFLYLAYPTDPVYNYLDANRLFFVNNGELSAALYTDIDTNFIDSLNLDSLKIREKYKASKNIPLLYKKDLNLLRNHKIINNQIANKNLKNLKKNIYDKISTLNKGNGIKLNGLYVMPSYFEYGNMIVNCSGAQKIYDSTIKSIAQLSIAHNSIDQIAETVNFNNIFNELINKLDSYLISNLKYVKSPTPLNFTINKIPVLIEKNINTNKTFTKYTINGIKINLEEISSCVKRALSYNTESEYNDFLNKVSDCSLFVHSVLDGGIDLSVLPTNNTNFNIRLDFTRIGKRNFLILDNKKYLCKNLRGFSNELKKINNYRFNNCSNLMALINIFSSKKYVDGVDTEDFINLILAGKDIYKKEKESLEESLNMTKTITNAKDSKLNINGNIYSGYEIKAISNTNYFISTDNLNTENYPIWKILPNERYDYICMVDRLPGKPGIDKLITRMLTLYNDSNLSNQINTL